QGFGAGHVPYFERAVGAGGNKHLTVRAERGGPNRSVVAGEIAGLLNHVEVPESSRVIGADRGELAALGIEYQSADFAVVTFEGPDGLSGVGIEKTDDAVVAADEQGPIVFAVNGAGIADAGRRRWNDAARRADRERRAGKVDVVDFDAV